MLTIHHLNASQSSRIVWLCEELELPYELVRYARDPLTKLAPPEYRALHPAGMAPVITDGDISLAESGAIIDYVIARYGRGRLVIDPESPSFAQQLFWYHFANGTLMPSLLVIMGDGGLTGFMEERVNRAFKMLDTRLESNIWLAGDDFTVADIMMLHPLTTQRLFQPIDLSPYPHILSYLDRIAARPAFQRAVKKTDPEPDRATA